MKSYPAPPIAPEIIDKIRRSRDSGKTQEEIFAEMRELGLFMGYSIKLAHDLLGMSPGEAKIAVHNSRTWSDCRQDVESFHEDVYQAAVEVGFEDVKAATLKHQEREALQSTR